MRGKIDQMRVLKAALAVLLAVALSLSAIGRAASAVSPLTDFAEGDERVLSVLALARICASMHSTPENDEAPEPCSGCLACAPAAPGDPARAFEPVVYGQAPLAPPAAIAPPRRPLTKETRRTRAPPRL